MDFNQNHFALFGLTPAFALDTEALDRAYRDLQAEIHPDRFAHAGEADQRLAVQWATRINEAYQTLRSPFERAAYLLRLHGIDAMDPGHTAMPTDFLMRQMEWREALAEAVAARDAPALEELERQTRAECKREIESIAELIDQRQDFAAAAEAVRKYRFLEKFLADIGNAYEELD